MSTDALTERKLKNLMLYRVVMGTTLLLVAVAVETVSETLPRINPLYYLIVATYAVTLGYVGLLRSWRALAPQVWLQALGDLALVTGLVYVTGGATGRASFMLLYPLSVLSGAVLLGRRTGLTLAGLAALMHGGMLLAVRNGVVAPQGLAEVLDLPARQLIYSIFVTAVACAGVATVGGYMAESLRTAGRQLADAAGQMADLRALHSRIVDSINSGLATTDEQGRILSVNAVGGAILGRDPASLRGATLRSVFGSLLLEPAALAARAADRRLARLELPYGGDQRELGLAVSRLSGHEGAPRGFLLVFQDLTDVKRLEREVRAKEKLAAVGEMAAHLAHEIRNPLGAISGSAQVLMAESGLSEEQARLLSIITRESHRLSGVLNQFLVRARPGAEPRGPVDLKPVLEEAVTLLRNATDLRPGHRVEFAADAGPHVCLAHPGQISQVFWNLARNALEAMPEGGLLSVALERAGDELRLRLSDQGRGLAAEEGRAWQAYASGTPMGSGLGLAIVYNIVREHGGDISLRSRPGHGTDVEVRLPAVREPQAA